ncbi:MAG: rhodanese-like domain-containing protein [Defluviitaleaceae bacterium]|nr:rhodanese-like domain-containing protein [Defluviitaleaceae bacterium]
MKIKIISFIIIFILATAWHYSEFSLYKVPYENEENAIDTRFFRGEEIEMNRNYFITASEAREKMKSNAIIVDVRTPEEFDAGRIPGAILLPNYTIRDKAGTVLADKDALILVYCRSGVRSRDAVYELISMGYTNVYDFGGINSWPYERE